MSEPCPKCQDAPLAYEEGLREAMEPRRDAALPARTRREFHRCNSGPGGGSFSGWMEVCDEPERLPEDEYRIPHGLCARCAPLAVGMRAYDYLPGGDEIRYEISKIDGAYAVVTWDYA